MTSCIGCILLLLHNITMLNMKKIIYSFISACLVSLPTIAQAQNNSDRLKDNLDFEDIYFYDYENNLDTWEDRWESKVHKNTFEIDTNIFYNGKKSLKFILDKKSDITEKIRYFIPTANVIGDSLQLKGWLKYSNALDCDIKIAISNYDYPNENYLQFHIQNISGNSGWKQFVSKAIYKETRYLTLEIQAKGEKGLFWFDNFSIEIDRKPLHEITTIVYPEVENEYNLNSIEKDIPTDLNKTQLNNIEVLCKVWGFLKYYHPIVSKGVYNWDHELLKFLPQCLNADKKHFNDILYKWIKQFGSILPIYSPDTNFSNATLMPDWDWIKNSSLNPKVKEEIINIINSERSGRNKYVSFNEFAGNISFSNEKYYPDVNLITNTSFRILLLCRYWNAIQYFYPYRKLIDKNWNDILHDYLPKVIQANTEESIQLTLMELTGKINDSHGSITFNKYPLIYETSIYSPYIIPANVIINKGKIIISDFNNDTWEKSLLKKGDVIKKVNNIKIDRIIEEKQKYFSSSNINQSLIKIYPVITSPTDTTSLLIKRNGKRKKIKLVISNYSNNYKTLLKTEGTGYKILEDSIAYIFPQELSIDTIPKMMNRIKNFNSLIIDLRCYPKDTIRNTLGNYLLPAPKIFAKESQIDLKNPGVFTYKKNYTIGKYNPDYFKGKVVILVDRNTISQSEFLAMAYRQAPKSIIIGQKTAGANGSITFLPLPGNMVAIFSGNGIYYPNGICGQRLGILIDKKVSFPMHLEGNNDDYILKQAIKWIKQYNK